MTGENKQINKSAIRNFSIQARNILMKSAVTEAGFYGVTKEQIKNPIQKGSDFEVYETLAGTEKRIFGPDIRRRANLVAAIRQKGFDEVIEETAYTWFNRLVAIRFMEINKYLPFRTRVLSSDTGSITPDIVSRFMDLDLHMTDEEVTGVQKAKEENRFDEAFRLLFIKVCNELNDILPGLFEKTDDYMELLLRLPYTSDGVVRMLVDTIPESNFNVNEGGQVEIIGWLYQYYNTEPKAKAFAKKGKITKEEIPAVTQLFTPDWIVRYMVENSLGRLWIEHLLANGDSRSEQEIANDFEWKYYLPEAEQEPEVAAQLVQIRAERRNLIPEEILCIDPCQGSGHILVYLFDVLMQIYREEGYSERDAARSILENNLFGLDIDDRAYQLSYFAVLMKAREYDRMILKKHIEPHVYSIQESNTIDRNQLKYFGADMSEFDKNNAINQLTGLLDTFTDAKEYGSILNVDPCDWELLQEFVENDRVEGQFALDALGIEQTQKQVVRLVNIGKEMGQKYYVVCTNPPYMGYRGMTEKLAYYVTDNYPLSKSDLFAVFIEKCKLFTKKNGMYALITQHSWMFLSAYEQLRKIVNQNNIINMAHLGARAFDEIAGEVVQTTAFIVRLGFIRGYFGNYSRLLEGLNEAEKETIFLSHKKVYCITQDNYSLIPGNPIAYWVSQEVLQVYKTSRLLGELASPKTGMTTGDNNRFLRLWEEVDFTHVSLHATSSESAMLSKKRWFPYCKGGGFRRYYGFFDYLVNWENDGFAIKNNIKPNGLKAASVRSEGLYFKSLITWSAVSSGSFSCRFCDGGALFDSGGSSIFVKDYSYYILGLLNSKVAQYFLDISNATINYQPGDVAGIPVVFGKIQEVEKRVRKCIEIVKNDWDSFETSWDYLAHPLIVKNTDYVNQKSGVLIAQQYGTWRTVCERRFLKLKEIEEEINRLFIEIYGLTKVLTPRISDQDVTIQTTVMK